jgi:predicted small integral membrane protein
MVVASLSPLFILWAIRGAPGVPDKWWIPFCLLCVIVPNIVLFSRWRIAQSKNDHRVILVRSATDRSEHLLVYLFAMLIPLFGVELGGLRSVIAIFVAVIFVVFVFWHMNLHYMNILFAAFGYHVFTIEAATSSSSDINAPTHNLILLSKRDTIKPSVQLDTVRLSDTVLVDKG